jgi:hypothetical protein
MIDGRGPGPVTAEAGLPRVVGDNPLQGAGVPPDAGVESGFGRGPGGPQLAPLAVIPQCQERGIGGRLVRDGLAAKARSGAGFVVLLGHPEYYARFGFRRARAVGLDNQYGAGEVFRILELASGSLPPGGGLVRYGAEFAAWGRDEPAAVPDRGAMPVHDDPSCPG